MNTVIFTLNIDVYMTTEVKICPFSKGQISTFLRILAHGLINGGGLYVGKYFLSKKGSKFVISPGLISGEIRYVV